MLQQRGRVNAPGSQGLDCSNAGKVFSQRYLSHEWLRRPARQQQDKARQQIARQPTTQAAHVSRDRRIRSAQGLHMLAIFIRNASHSV
jgi:hypothetical protein